MRARYRMGCLLLSTVVSASSARAEPAHAGPPGRKGAYDTATVSAAASSSPPAPSPTEAEVQAADHYLKGIHALEAGKTEEARAELLVAWKLKQHFQIAANLGAVELELGHHRDAAEHLAYFLREAKGVRDEEIRQARQMLKEARRHGGAQKIDEEPSGAEARAPRKPAGVESSPVVPVEASRPAVVSIVVGGVIATAAIGVGAGLLAAANDKAEEAKEIRSELGSASACTAPVTAAPGRCADLKSALSDKDALSTASKASFIVGGAVALGTAGFTVWQLGRTKDSALVRVTPTVGRHQGGIIVQGSW